MDRPTVDGALRLDAIPSDAPAMPAVADPGTTEDARMPRVTQGHIGGPLAKLSWKARMRWLDDGGR